MKEMDRRQAPLTVQELKDAEMAILQFTQSQIFSKEFNVLKRISSGEGGDKWGLAKQNKTELKK